MEEHEHITPQKDIPERRESEEPPLPPGKRFQIMLLQTAVFAAVFFTILWLVEKQSVLAALIGFTVIAYLISRKFANKG